VVCLVFRACRHMHTYFTLAFIPLPNCTADDTLLSKEASIFNLFRERGMLGGAATGSPGGTGTRRGSVPNVQL